MSASSEAWTCVKCARHGHGGAPIQVTKFSHDGKYCLTGGNDKSIVLWNPFRDADASQLVGAPAPKASDPTATAASALLVQRYSGQHGGEIVDLAITRDGSRFASAGGQDKCAIVWDVTSGNVIRKIFGHDGRLTSCAWNDYSGPGGEANILATASVDKNVRLWDLRAQGREPLQVLAEAKDSVTRVIIEGPGAVDESLRTAAMLGGHPKGSSASSSAPPAAVRVVTSSMDGQIRTYDLRKASMAVLSFGPPISTIAVAHSGAAYLASTFTPARGGALVLMDRQSGTVLNTYSGHTNLAYRLGCAFTSDDARVMSGSEDGRLCIWDTLAQPNAPAIGDATADRGGITAHTRAVSWVEPHPKPGVRAVLTASFDGTAKLWAVQGALDAYR